MLGEKEIPTTTMYLMVGTALFYDVVQFLMVLIPIVGWIFESLVSLFAFLTFWLWFKMYGKTFLRPSRFLAMGAGVIIEMIPLLNALPGWTVAVLFLIGIEKADKIVKKVFGQDSFATKAIKSLKR